MSQQELQGLLKQLADIYDRMYILEKQMERAELKAQYEPLKEMLLGFPKLAYDIILILQKEVANAQANQARV